MKHLITYQFTFKQLRLSISKNDVLFNLELKSLNKIQTFPKIMQISNQFIQTISIQCIVDKNNLEFKDKIRRAYVILTDGNSKKSAGFANFDLGKLLNQKQKDHHFDIPLTQCPDPNSLMKFSISIQRIESIHNESEYLSNNQLSEDSQRLHYSSREEIIKLKSKLEKSEKLRIYFEQQFYQSNSMVTTLTKEKLEMETQINQLYQLNLDCIEKIKFFEKLVNDLKNTKYQNKQI